MPKSSGSSLKVVRAPPRPQPSRKIKHFDQPVPAGGAPKHADKIKPSASTPPKASNALAAEAVRIASSPGGIDGTQQRY
jgi:hypothetical protein